MELALIDALVPIDIENTLGDGGHFVHLVGVEGDDAKAYEVCHVLNGLVLASLEFQLSFQRAGALYTFFHGGDVDALFLQRFAEHVIGILGQFFQYRQQVVVLAHELLSVSIQIHFLVHIE